MVHRRFERFLDDSRVYQECRQFWERLAADIARSTGSATDWRSWIPRAYIDGTPMELEDTPIWDGRSDQLRRAYRIIQGRAETDTLEIAAWLTSYEEEYEEMPRDELSISLSFSEESASIARELLRKWMAPSTTPEEMQAFMAETIPPSSCVDSAS
jgi:hypothetical protein